MKLLILILIAEENTNLLGVDHVVVSGRTFKSTFTKFFMQWYNDCGLDDCDGELEEPFDKKTFIDEQVDAWNNKNDDIDWIEIEGLHCTYDFRVIQI